MSLDPLALALVAALAIGCAVRDAPHVAPVYPHDIYIVVVDNTTGLGVEAEITVLAMNTRQVFYGWAVLLRVSGGGVWVRVRAPRFAPQQRFVLPGVRVFSLGRVSVTD